jgi:cytochrome b561
MNNPATVSRYSPIIIGLQWLMCVRLTAAVATIDVFADLFQHYVSCDNTLTRISLINKKS